MRQVPRIGRRSTGALERLARWPSLGARQVKTYRSRSGQRSVFSAKVWRLRLRVVNSFLPLAFVLHIGCFLGACANARGDADFTLGLNFTATRSSQISANPPDTMGAVGLGHIVELNNGRFAIYDKSNGETVRSKTLNQFWSDAGVSPSGSFAFDPRVLFDPFANRWYAVSVDNQRGANNFLVAVSNSADPNDPWTGFKIESDPNDNRQWADFPTLGFDAQRLSIAADMIDIGLDNKSSVTLLTIPKADLLSAVPTVENKTLFQNRTGQGFSQQPAVNMDNSVLPLAVLSTTGGVDGFFFRSEISGPVSNPSFDVVAFPQIPLSSSPPAADQPTIGGAAKANIHAGSSRFSSNVIVQNGSIWAVRSIRNDGRAAVRWLELRESDSEILQTGLIADDQLAVYFPSIAVNDFGQVVIGFSGSSQTQPVSSYAVVGKTTDGTTDFGPITLLKAGVDDYQRLDSKGRNRWGDYSATVVDPNSPNTFWTFQQFVSGNDQWAIQITEIKVGTSPLLPGDANGDDRVNRADVSLLLSEFSFAAGGQQADFSGDGRVSLVDLAILQPNVGSAALPALVPEPSAGLLAIMGSALLAFRSVSRGRRCQRRGDSDRCYLLPSLHLRVMACYAKSGGTIFNSPRCFCRRAVSLESKRAWRPEPA